MTSLSLSFLIRLYNENCVWTRCPLPTMAKSVQSTEFPPLLSQIRCYCCVSLKRYEPLTVSFMAAEWGSDNAYFTDLLWGLKSKALRTDDQHVVPSLVCCCGCGRDCLHSWNGT